MQTPEPRDARRIFIGTALEARPVREAGRSRVRVHVREWLTKGRERRIDLWQGPTSCSFRFIRGNDYLVIAEPKDGRLEAHACSGTAPVGAAADDLLYLRAWRDGRELPRRVYGEARRNGQPLPKVALRLTGTAADRSAETDVAGGFVFDGLAPGLYVLSAGDSSMDVDLIDDRCLVATATDEDGSFRLHSPFRFVLPKDPQPFLLPEPPALHLPLVLPSHRPALR